MNDLPTPSAFKKKLLSLTPVQKSLSWLVGLHRSSMGDSRTWENNKRTQALLERGEKVELVLQRVLNEHGIDCDKCKLDAEEALKPLEVVKVTEYWGPKPPEDGR